MKHAILWTWDWRICRQDEFSYLENYKILIDHMAGCGLTGLIIWGFLDEKHGGEESARNLCKYAKSKGVGIIPGMGVLSYGGIFCRGNHRFNLETYLQEHPEYSAVDENGNPAAAEGWFCNAIACPSKRENIEWTKEGLRWLFKNFDISGVMLETGDNGICQCPQCRERNKSADKHEFSLRDMAGILPEICRDIREVSPQALIVYSTYTNYWQAGIREEAASLSAIPDDALANWTVATFYNRFTPPADNPAPPTRRNLAYAKYCGSTHWNWVVTPTFAGDSGFESRYACRAFQPCADAIKNLCHTAEREGFEGVIIEASGLPSMPDNEINYLALGQYVRDAEKGIEEFWAENLSTLYGPEAAAPVMEIFSEQGKNAECLKRYYLWYAELMDRGEIRWEKKYDSRDWDEIISQWKELTAFLKSQLKRTDNAKLPAHSEGRKRLDTIHDVLREYLHVYSRFLPKLLPFLKEDNHTALEISKGPQSEMD